MLYKIDTILNENDIVGKLRQVKSYKHYREQLDIYFDKTNFEFVVFSNNLIIRFVFDKIKIQKSKHWGTYLFIRKGGGAARREILPPAAPSAPGGESMGQGRGPTHPTPPHPQGPYQGSPPHPPNNKFYFLLKKII